MTSPHSQTSSFGPFRLSSSSRQLLRDGTPLILGDRAFDILSVLVENAGRVVSQKELMAESGAISSSPLEICAFI